MRSELKWFVLLLVVSYGVAYWASIPDEGSKTEKFTVFTVEPKSIESLSYVEDKLEVKIAKRSGQGYWVDFTKTEEPKSPPTGGDEGAPGTPKQTTETFLASNKISEVFGEFNPFEARRLLGKLSDVSSEEFGFGEGAAKMTLVAKGKTWEFEIGKKSYGSRFQFVYEKSNDRVMLVDGKAIETLARANVRLYERKFVGFELDDVTEVTVKTAKGQKVMSHTQRDAKGNLLWSLAGGDGTPKPVYKSWMDKIDRLMLMHYVEQSEVSGIQKSAVFEIEFKKGGAVLDTARFFKSQGVDGTTDYWVTSKHLESFAKLHKNRMEPIVKDLALVFEE